MIDKPDAAQATDTLGRKHAAGSAGRLEKADQGYATGRVLPMLLADHGVDVKDVQNTYIGSFSAAFSIARQLLMSDQDRALVRVVALADSSYSSGTNMNPDPTEGYEE